jgi:hypothetical protein
MPKWNVNMSPARFVLTYIFDIAFFFLWYGVLLGNPFTLPLLVAMAVVSAPVILATNWLYEAYIAPLVNRQANQRTRPQAGATLVERMRAAGVTGGDEELDALEARLKRELPGYVPVKRDLK